MGFTSFTWFSWKWSEEKPIEEDFPKAASERRTKEKGGDSVFSFFRKMFTILYGERIEVIFVNRKKCVLSLQVFSAQQNPCARPNKRISICTFLSYCCQINRGVEKLNQIWEKWQEFRWENISVWDNKSIYVKEVKQKRFHLKKKEFRKPEKGREGTLTNMEKRYFSLTLTKEKTK